MDWYSNNAIIKKKKKPGGHQRCALHVERDSKNKEHQGISGVIHVKDGHRDIVAVMHQSLRG